MQLATPSAMPPGAAPAPTIAPRIEELVEALRDPACYPHPVDEVAVIETHISYVLLAGAYAYKLKKPVRLPFVDFSSALARHHYCREELRLNRRTAPQLYLSVEGIGGDPRHPRVGGAQPTWEYAVRMRRFPQEALYSRLAAADALTDAHVDALAETVARFHGSLAGGASPPVGLGTPQQVAAPAIANFREIAALQPVRGRLLRRLEDWTLVERHALDARFRERRAAGFVRECHGDLHLRNVASLEDTAVLFDCIEFGARYRWSDVMSDVAFAFMDLYRFGRARQAWRLLDAYLARSGDHDGVDVLRFYAVYRAMVRAKVALIRAHQAGVGPEAGCARAEFDAYVRLAARLSERAPRVLVLMHGVSGSGKSTVAQRLLEAMGAVRLRSDVERKRLHGVPAGEHAAPGVGAGLYDAAATQRTFARLEALARRALLAGYPVIVDATFLERDRRRHFHEVARSLGAAFQVVSCGAPPEVLRERVAARAALGRDASDAGPAVLGAQLAAAQPLDDAEHRHVTMLDTTCAGRWEPAVEALARRLSCPAE